MKVILRDGTLSALAVRTADCAACGARVRDEREFLQAVRAARPHGGALALSALLARVDAWRSDAACCEQCPERRAVTR